MLSRVSSFSEVNYLMTLNMNTASNLTQAQTQESSGLLAQTYGALPTDVGKLLNVDNQVARLQVDGDNATSALSTMQQTYSTMTSITSLGASILSSLTGYMSGGTIDTAAVSSSASSWLSGLTSELNTQYGGVYLFSGTSTDTAPINTTTSGYDPNTNPTGYYEGSATTTSYTGSDGFTLPTSVKASDPGFEKMLQGISLIAASPGSSSTLTQAYTLIQTGSQEVAAAQANLSANSASLTSYQSEVSSKVTALQTVSAGLEKSDLAATTVIVTNYTDQLTASYQTITKLMSDSLASHLT